MSESGLPATFAPTSDASRKGTIRTLTGGEASPEELFPQGDKTKLVLTHERIETFIPEKYPELAKSNFLAGWTQFMDKGLMEFLKK